MIFDLDDTIYPIKPFADEMFATLFNLLKSQLSDEVYQQVKEDVLTTPFHRVADRYKFNKELKEEGMKLLLKMTYNGPIKAFEDYQIAKDLAIEKFLVGGLYRFSEKQNKAPWH